MARTRAVAQFACGVVSVGILVLLMRSGSVVTGMAARAVRLEGRIPPVDDFRVVLMTRRTREVAAMIERLIGQTRVTVVRRRPGVRVMAQAAVLAGIEVARILAGRCRAVVAGGAGPENLVVIYGRHGHPDGRAVAVFTDIRRLHMQRPLARGLGAVVTAEAVVHDVDVVEVRRRPSHCRVAVIAVIAAGDVRRMLAGCRYAVVAGAAGADDLRVIDRQHRRPDVARVAILTNVTRLNMRRPFTGCVDPVMAAETVARDVHVVEVGRQPACRRVAVVAVVAARDVGRMLPGRRDAVVAGAAGAEDLGVVHGKHGRPDIARMAVLADVGGLHVCRRFASCFGAVVTAETVADDVHVVEIRR